MGPCTQRGGSRPAPPGQFWGAIISKYPPALVGTAENVLDWAKEMATEWLQTGMFQGLTDKDATPVTVVDYLCSQSVTKAHNRHISPQKAKDLGLNVGMLEDDQRLQERVLSVHHAFMLTLAHKPILKLIENHNGIAYSQGYEVASP